MEFHTLSGTKEGFEAGIKPEVVEGPDTTRENKADCPASITGDLSVFVSCWK